MAQTSERPLTDDEILQARAQVDAATWRLVSKEEAELIIRAIDAGVVSARAADRDMIVKDYGLS